jgi:hypothetical protein
MRHRLFKLIAAASLVVLLSAMNAFAGTGKRVGTAGAMELLVPVGARGTALGGNFIAGITGVDAMYWNPAGVAGSTRTAEVMVSQMNYFADIDLTYLALQANVGKFGFLGASIKTMNFGDIEETTNNAPDGTGSTFSPGYMTLGLTYARSMTDRILFGVTTKLVSERIMTVSATGFAFDFGVQYNTEMGLRLGVTLRNLGSSMRFSGSALEQTIDIPNYLDQPISQQEALQIVSQSFEMPTTMDIGLSYTMNPVEHHSVTIMGDFRNHQFGMDSFGGGLEYTFKMDKFAASLRGGAMASQDVENGKIVFKDDTNVLGPCFGGGLFYQLAPQLNLNVDYAYRINERLSDNQVFSLTIGF